MGIAELRLRRIVTGHDAAGKAVILDDRPLSAAGLAEDPARADAAFFQVWATYEMPVSLSNDAATEQQRGSARTTVGTGTGTVLRVGVLGPGVRSPMHRTESIDYGICLQGECDLELDSGEVVSVRAGDVVIQRGTNHVWHNRSDAPCRIAWVLIDAEPATVSGRKLGASWYHEEPND